MTNLEARYSQNKVVIKYRIDTGSNGNVMPYHVFKMLLPRTWKEQLVAKKGIILKTDNKAKIRYM